MELVLNICAHPVTFASETSSSVQLPGHAKARTMFAHAPLSSYGEKEWTRIIKSLRKGRNVFLRRDANAYILSLAFMQCLDPTRVDGEEDDPTNYNFRPIDASGSGQMTLTPAIIEAIESHHDGIVNELIDTDPDEKELDVFGTQCDKVLDQLELQKTLGGLKATLTGIVMGHIVAECNEAAEAAADRPRTRSGASPARPKPPSKKELAAKKRQVQARIDGYLEDITALLTPPTANTAEGDAVNAAAFAAVRKTVRDFSAYLTNGLEHVAEKWAEKCLVRLEEMEVGLLAKLRDDAESLLRGWCTEVLDPPALVKCGYATQPLEEYSMPVPSSSAGKKVDDTVEVDEVVAGAGDNDDDDDDDDHMPVPDDDDDEATVPKTVPTPTKLAMFDDVDSDVEMGVRVGGDEDDQEEESDIDESQPLLTQAPPGFDQHEASSSDEEEEEGAKEDAQMTPSRITRRAADLKKKSLSTVITESAAAATADSSSHKKPPASASQGRKAPATAPRRRKGSTGKTPVRRSPPPRGVQDDSDLDYKGSPKRVSTKAQLRKEDVSSDDDTSDDADDKKPKAVPRSRAASSTGKKKANLTYDDSSEEESFDDDPFASSSTKKTPSSRGREGNAKSPKRTPRLSGTKLCTSSSSSEYENTSQDDSTSSDDDEDIPSPSAKSRAVPPTPVPRIQPQSTRGVNVPRSAGKKRKRWTDEEKDIVRKGIRRHGVGHWAMIKSDWPMELRDRTSVQIKDCYRTMLKRGELSESDSESITEGL